MTLDLLRQYAARMKELAAQYDDLKEQQKVIDAEYDELRLKLVPELMAEMDIRTTTYEGIGRVQLTGDCYASIPADVKPLAFDWLRENGFGDLIQPTVNPSTLKAFAKEQLKNGEVLPEGLFKVTPYTRATVVKAK